MREKLVSVIIPAYNAENTLARAVRSALLQTESRQDLRLEVLIVDDGSTDGTGAAAEALAERDSRVRVWHTKGRGVSAARNLALSQAEGDLVTFLDADDALAPGMIGALAAVLEKEGADIAGCTFGEEASAGEGSGAVTLYTGERIISEGILARDTRVWSKLFTRKILRGVSFREGLTIGEDMLFFLSCIRRDTGYALLDRKLYLYTVNPQGAMEKPFVPAYFDQILCWEEAKKLIWERFPDLLQDADHAARLAAIEAVSCMLVAAKLAGLEKGDRKQYSGRIEEIRRKVQKLSGAPGMRKYLPAGYGAKIALFLHTPGLYFAVMKGRQGR